MIVSAVAANMIKAVPITQAISAVFAVPIFAGFPDAVKYNIPVITHPIIIIDEPTDTNASLILLAIPLASCAKTITGRILTNKNETKNSIFLFIYLYFKLL